MVFVEQQNEFIKRLNESALEPLIREIRSPEIGDFSAESAIASDIALNLLICVKADNRQQAERYYAQFSKRHPTVESHWIYDNYVLFCVVAAVVKFNFDIAWIADVINLSLSGANKLHQGIRESFKNLLAGNYNAKNDYHQISLVYQFLAKDEHFDDEHIKKVFNEIWLKPFPFYNEDFLDLISLKAVEVAVVKKSLLTFQEEYNLKYFVPAFDRKANVLASVISWTLIVGLTLTIFFALWKLNSLENKWPNFVKPFFFSLGVSGVGVLGFVAWKKNLAKLIRKILNSFFHYKEITR